MPHDKLIEAVKKTVSARGLKSNVSSRIVAWLDQADGGEFAAKDREEQLQKILDVLPGYSEASD